MKKENKNEGLRLSIISFCVTVLFFVAVNLLTICTLKMESTISSEPYNVILIKEGKDEKINITLFNRENVLDFSRINAYKRQFSSLEIFIPPIFRCVEIGLKSISSLANNRVCERFSS